MIYLLILSAAALIVSFALGGLFAIWYTTREVHEAMWGEHHRQGPLPR